MAFETKEEVQALHAIVWERFGGQPRGFMFTTADIESILGISRDSQSFEWVRAKFIRRMLKEHGIQVHWEHGSQSHRLLTHRDQVTYGADKVFRKARRQIEKCRRVLLGVDPSQLPIPLRRLLLVKRDEIRAVKRRMIQARNNVGGPKPMETNPLRRTRAAVPTPPAAAPTEFID